MSDPLIVSDKFRTSFLSYIEGGTSIMINYNDRSLPRQYDKVHYPLRFTQRAIENNPNNIRDIWVLRHGSWYLLWTCEPEKYNRTYSQLYKHKYLT